VGGLVRIVGVGGVRERGNLGFLMYLADAAGYLGYSAVMVGKSYLAQEGDFLRF
jgi:hypothetical protein